MAKTNMDIITSYCFRAHMGTLNKQLIAETWVNSSGIGVAIFVVKHANKDVYRSTNFTKATVIFESINNDWPGMEIIIKKKGSGKVYSSFKTKKIPTTMDEMMREASLNVSHPTAFDYEYQIGTHTERFFPVEIED